MKKRYLLYILIPVVLLVGWFTFRAPPHDPHYDAAACVAVNVLGTPSSQQDFADKIRTVIINENNSYSLRHVSYDNSLGQSSIARYQRLSEAQKSEAKQNVDSCIRVMSAAGR